MQENAQTDTKLVLDRIRQDIVAGTFVSGARLRIEDLAKRYGVSPMPVRESLGRLHGEGLVVIEQNRGARVRNIDERFVENLFDIRAALESMLAMRGALRRSQDDIAKLRLEQEQLEAFISLRDYPAILEANRRFHKILNDAAGNDEALTLADRHWYLIASLWKQYGYREERFVGVISDHRQLIEAVERKDGSAAGAIMQAHVIKSKYDLLKMFRASGTASS
ncbi:MAG: GntR family transcriptional regulator [Proteobacteria bacterium]|nr:GntR family transcriptional regulator [Pseudomonadota bacterium]